jgi:transposase
VVANLGELDEEGRLGVQRVAQPDPAPQASLFDRQSSPEWVEVDLGGVRVERSRPFGGGWLGLMLLRQLGLNELLEALMPSGREEIPWRAMTVVLVLGRWLDPCSELHLAEHGYEAGALAELLGVPAAKVNDDRLYRSLDRLLPHKPALEKHLKQRLGELFDLDYDLLLYDVTSTYFEGAAAANPQAQRGYSRDHRPDCKQVNIALVVSRGGLPLGYEVFAGNRSDVTTVKEIVAAMQSKYGQANRIWVMDRGMVSADNVEFLQQRGRRYILGTPKSRAPSDRFSSLGWKSRAPSDRFSSLGWKIVLRKFEQQLLGGNWREVHQGLEVKLCPAPGGEEVFILCRSAQRQLKEQAVHDRFERRIEQKLEAMAEGCGKRKQNPLKVAQQVGRLLGKNSRAAGLFQVDVESDTQGWAHLRWSKRDQRRDWMKLSEGCYLLRSNVTDWSGEQLWRAYIQLTEAEEAFRLHKSDLAMRPVWHHKQHRVQAHILVCFLAYVLWKTLGQWCQRAGLGDQPRKIFAELQQISLVDLVLPTPAGVAIRKRYVSRPTDHPAILLQRLGLKIPAHIEFADL